MFKNLKFGFAVGYLKNQGIFADTDSGFTRWCVEKVRERMLEEVPNLIRKLHKKYPELDHQDTEYVVWPEVQGRDPRFKIQGERGLLAIRNNFAPLEHYLPWGRLGLVINIDCRGNPA